MTDPKDTQPKSRKHHFRPSGASWRSADILRAAAIVAGLLIVLKLLWVANQIVIVAFLGTLFGVAVASGVDKLERFRVPRGVGAAFIVVSFLMVLYTLGSIVAPTVAQQGHDLKRRLPDAVERAEKWLNSKSPSLMSSLLGNDTTEARALADSVRTNGIPSQTRGAQGAGARDSAAVSDSSGKLKAAPPMSLRQNIGKKLVGSVRYLFPFLTSTFETLAGLLLILMMSVYIGAEPDTYKNGLLHLFPKRKRERMDEVMAAMSTMLRKWLVTQLIAMLVIGAASTIALLILRVNAPFALGIIAGLLEFVPTIGPILSAIPAIAMGFLDSPEKALYVGLAYLAIQQLENHLLIPLLMKGGMDLPPVLTIVTQGLMALLFGFLGLLIAVPLLAAVMVPVKMLYVEDALGDDMIENEKGEIEPANPPLPDG
jgi:predicted PurR-regulated permease PerM